MPPYIRRGEIPAKRHTQFRKPGGGLYSEQLFSTEGFSSDSSLFYHTHPPTSIVRAGASESVAPRMAAQQSLRPMSFEGFAICQLPDYLYSRLPLFVNADLLISLAAPGQSMADYFYKNAEADELIFVHEGCGEIRTPQGKIIFGYGDYILIPRGTIYQMHFCDDHNRMLIVESFSPIRFPDKYLSKSGQLLEHAPYCERDLRAPQELVTLDETGEFLIKIKKKGVLHELYYRHHPFDLAGWDGCCYPLAFSIHDFEPITGRLHQPPPVHQTFEARNFVVCSFVPRLFDYHPLSIPAPYNHSNIDSDELLYYVDGDFMSRKNVTRGMLTLHPGGIPHGPHPGTVEKSIGAKETKELAVMIDTFHPLQLTKTALDIENKEYTTSWV